MEGLDVVKLLSKAIKKRGVSVVFLFTVVDLKSSNVFFLCIYVKMLGSDLGCVLGPLGRLLLGYKRMFLWGNFKGNRTNCLKVRVKTSVVNVIDDA